MLIGVETQIATRSVPIRTSWTFIANSVVAAAIGLAMAFLGYHFSLAVAGWIAGRDPELLNTGTVFRAGGSDLAYVGGSVGALLLAGLLLSLYPGSRDRSGGRLVMLWTILFSFEAVFLDLVRVAFDPESPLALALAEVDLPEGLDLVLAVAGGLGLVLVAMSAAPAFLGFARHRSEVATRGERLRFSVRMALLPGILGPLLTTPLFLGEGSDQILPYVPFLGLFTILTVAASLGSVTFRPPEIVEERGLSFGLLASAVIVLALYVLLLRTGIPIPPWDENLQFTFD